MVLSQALIIGSFMTDVKIGILSKGDEVVNVFPYGECIAIAIRKKNAKVDIVLLEKNTDGMLFVSRRLIICEGDGSVEATLGHMKASTF